MNILINIEADGSKRKHNAFLQKKITKNVCGVYLNMDLLFSKCFNYLLRKAVLFSRRLDKYFFWIFFWCVKNLFHQNT